MSGSAADDTRAGDDRYPGCGATLSANAPEGLCVDCLMLLLEDYGDADPLRPDTLEGESLGEVGDYEILERIAAGGMGVVYKARQKNLHRLVALKLISEGKFAGHTDRERFLFEARAAGELDHPNIVPVYEVGEDQGQSFFSMRLVTGGDLGDRLAPPASAGSGRRTETTLLPGAREWLVALVKLLIKVARAVHHAHEQGILHRDLKPSNILIDKHGEPQVTDFGLAKRVHEVSSLTLSGQVLGSPAYMAPEQAEGSTELTPAVDVYALGVILYQALTGLVPFGGDAPMAILQQKLTKEPKAPRRLQTRVDRDLETICLRCLERAPSKRYASAEALAADLQRWLEGRPIHAKPAGPSEILIKWIRRKPAVAALILLALVASAVLAVIVQRHRASEQDNRNDAYAREIALADERIRQNDLPGARSLLTKYAGDEGADLRGIEWRLLWRECQREPAMNTFTMDGRRVMHLGSDPTRPGTLLVQLDNGRLLRGGAIGQELYAVDPSPERASWNFHFDGGGRFFPAHDAEKGAYLLRSDLKRRWVLPAAVIPQPGGFLAAAALTDSVLCLNGLRTGETSYRVWDLRDAQPSSLPAPRDELQAVDYYLDPESDRSFFLDERAVWRDAETFEEVDPRTRVIPGTFGIERRGDRIPHLLRPPSPRIRLRHFQGFEEDAIRTIDGANLQFPECVCAFLRHDDRAVTLHVMESVPNRLVVRVGKHPPRVRTESVTVLRGEGVVGPIDFAHRAIRLDQSVRSFFSDRDLGDTEALEVELDDPRRRSGERRFFSEFIDENALGILFSQPSWPAGTAMEIDLLLGFAEKKLALHMPRITFLQESSPVESANLVMNLVETAMVQRGFIVEDEIRFTVNALGNGFGLLRLDFRERLEMGKLDICAVPPPEPPELTRASGVVAPDALIRIEGGSFGNRLEDLCIVLAPPAGNPGLPTIPLRPVALKPDGSELLARVVGIVSDGQPRRLMMAKGEGYQRHVALPFPDVWQEQSVWSWRGLGVPAAVSPEPLEIALGSEHEQRFAGAVTPAGTLEVTLSGDWPAEARVKVAFTANTETVQQDSYTPSLCFSAGGTLLDCAARIKSAIERAFIQGGLTDGNQVQIQINVTGENEVTLTASVFTPAGAEDPIILGHLEVSVSEEEDPCLPGESDDSDGDYIQDGWEVAQFGALPPLVAAGDDDDDDGLSNAFEFAFHTHPKLKDAPSLNVIIDEDHGLISYIRNEAAIFYYHFDIETSLDDGENWERLNNVDVLEIHPVGNERVTVLSRVFLSVEALKRSLFRVKVTPR